MAMASMNVDLPDPFRHDSSWQPRGETLASDVEELDMIAGGGDIFVALTRAFSDEQPTVMRWE